MEDDMAKGKRTIYRENVIIEGGLHIHLSVDGDGQQGDPLVAVLRSLQGMAGPTIAQERPAGRLPSATESTAAQMAEPPVRERPLAKPSDKTCPICGVVITKGASACRAHALQFHRERRNREAEQAQLASEDYPGA
jgi:hypothetical protein